MNQAMDSLWRLAALATLTGALAAGLGRLAWGTTGDLMAMPGSAATGTGVLTEAVAAFCLWAGVLAASWYALTCAALVVSGTARMGGGRARGIERAVRRWGFPTLRRAVLSTAAAGAGAMLTLGPAAAGPGTLPEDLGWGAPHEEPALPEDVPATPADEPRPPGEPPPPPDRPAPPEEDPSTEPEAGTYRVRPGDSLWSIAAAHLDPGADAAAVTSAWPAWYEANRDVIGPDPHLIHPELTLQIPTEETS